MADEPLGCAEKRRVEAELAGWVKGVGLPELDLVGRHQADARVMVVLVMPGCEPAAKGAGSMMVWNRLGIPAGISGS